MSPFRARLSLQVEAQSPMRYLWRSRGPNGEKGSDISDDHISRFVKCKVWETSILLRHAQLVGMPLAPLPAWSGGAKTPPNPPDQLRDLVHLIHEGAAADKSIGCTQELYDLNKSDIDVTWTYLDYLHGSCSAPGDFVSLHCPLNADTKHLINKEHWSNQSLEAVNVGTWGPKRTILFS